jgi:hypothetical protein
MEDRMGLLIWLAEAATAANVVLLVALAAVWGRNYRRLRSKHSLGLLVFAMLLLFENSLSLYYYLWDPFLSGWYRDPTRVPTAAMRSMMILDILETAAVLFLVWITLD